MNDNPFGVEKNTPTLVDRRDFIELHGRQYEVHAILGDARSFLTLVVVPTAAEIRVGPEDLVQALGMATAGCWAAISENTEAADAALINVMRAALARHRANIRPVAVQRAH